MDGRIILKGILKKYGVSVWTVYTLAKDRAHYDYVMNVRMSYKAEHLDHL
jgi:hypothetical protein